MSKIETPSDIERIFDKPGCQWSLNERVRVWEWLWEDPLKSE